MKAKCIVCNKDVPVIERCLNALPMYICSECGLTWRKSFDLPERHYEELEVHTNSTRIRNRLRNSLDRIHTIKNFVDLDSVCDIGSGDGVFLMALHESGYQDGVGVEPSERGASFSKQNGLLVYRGSLEDVANITHKHRIHTYTMFHLIEHLQDPRKALSDLFTIMQSGDTLVIETPNIDAYIFKKLSYKHGLIYPEHFFYFNQITIRQLLKDVSFKIVAEGRRDFKSETQSIRSLLFKLGIGRKGPVPGLKKGETSQTESDIDSSDTQNKQSSSETVKRAVRKVLQTLVHLLGRDDYLWVVVRKP